MGFLTLVLGGTKSGKTKYAEGLAKVRESSGGKILYLATAEALDDEMRVRISKHQMSRPESWDTIEEPIDLLSVFEKHGNKYDLILLDCLTLWATNKIVKAGDDYHREDLIKSVVKDCNFFIDKALSMKSELVIVSNQVELGLASSYTMGRLFQDLSGLLHQEIAASANRVVVTVAGLPVAIKGEI